MIGRDWHADVNAYSLLRLKGWYVAAAVVAVAAVATNVAVAAVVADAAVVAVAVAAVVAVAVAPVDAAVSNYLYPAIK